MISFLLTLAFIACFLLGGFVTFRICEYYNRIIRTIQRQRRHVQADLPELDSAKSPRRSKQEQDTYDAFVRNYVDGTMNPVLITKDDYRKGGK